MTVVALEQPDRRAQWEERLRQAARKEDESQWEIGDAIIDADEGWGDKYTAAMQITGKPEKTLKNYVYVCSNVDKSQRRDHLSFGHHAVVARLQVPEQNEWLDQAEAKDWSVSELRKKVNPSRRERANATRYTLKPTPEEDLLWVRAATSKTQAVEEWLTDLANRAAKRAPKTDGSGEGASA